MKTIVYELNEVPTKLFDFYANAFPDSTFAVLKEKALLYETHTADVGHLSPWVTWPTMHRGVSNVAHTISEIGQDLTHVNKDYPAIWESLAKSGVKAGVFGCLQSYPLPKYMENFSFYVPDTFAAGTECFPESLSSFQAFNLSMVRASGRNVSSGIVRSDLSSFLLNARRMGLTVLTAKKLASQMIGERINKDRVVRRRTSQVEIAFDLFYKQLSRSVPDISFFFTNHVASSMHRYWPTIFPNDYEEGQFDADWLVRWNQEIPHAVRVANWQLGKLMRFCDEKGVRLLVASSMGQGPVSDTIQISKQAMVRNVKKLLTYLKISDDMWQLQLSMAPRVVIKPLVADFEHKLKSLEGIDVNGEKIHYTVTSTGEIRFDLSLVNADEIVVTDKGSVIDPDTLGIVNLDLQDAAGSYAYHIPQGILMDYVPNQPRASAASSSAWNPVSVLDFAPSLIHKFGGDVPSYMEGDTRLFA